ncbi:MAG: M1 family metallopeptidase [Vicingaceae bacterium]
MLNIKLSFTGAFLVLCSIVVGQVSKRTYYADDKLAPTAHPMDFTHLKLEVSFEPEKGKVIGHVTHDFTVLASTADSLYFHGEELEISAAFLDQLRVACLKRPGGYTIKFSEPFTSDEQHQLVIDYTATPKKGIYFIGWNDETNRSRKQIWTQGQGMDNRHWIPMYDLPNDKVTTEILVKMEEGYEVLSNGLLLSNKKQKDGNVLWHYRMKQPHATYLIMLGIGDYEIKKSKSPSGVPMNFYYYSDWEDRITSTYLHSEDMVRFMEEETGVPYPWPSYSQIPVQDFLYGAMENTTATIFGDFYFTDSRGFLDRNYVRVNAHELAHQWFGDYVTARTSAHHWLQESFATHYDLRYQMVAFGKDHFDWARRKAAMDALAASKEDFKPLAHSSAGTARHYPKGSYVLQMLRDVAGEENYKRSIEYYLKKHAYSNVDSRDLLIAFHERSGLSLDWFWEEWIYKGGEPTYKVAFETSHRESDHYGRFIVEQVQEINELTGLFKMPIDFEVHFEDGSKVADRLWVKNQYHIFDFELPQGKNISYVLFDAGSKVLKSVEFIKPFDMLIHQSTKAEGMLDRYDAVVGLATTPVLIKRTTLRSIFKSNEFHAIRIEALKQLMADPESNDLLPIALRDADPEVRIAAIGLTPFITPELLDDYEALLLDSSYQVIELAFRKLTNQYEGREEVNNFLELTRGIEGNNERNVLITWLQTDYYQNKTVESLERLVDFVSPSFEFRTRVKAAQTLKSLNYLDEKLLNHLFDALFSANPRLRGPVKELLDQYYSTMEGRTLIREVVAKSDWEDWQKKRLNRVLR